MCNVNIGRDGHRFREQTKSILVERLKKRNGSFTNDERTK